VTSRRDSSSCYRCLRRATPISRRVSCSGPPLPMGKFLSFSHTHVLRVFAISMMMMSFICSLETKTTFDAYAHSLIVSVQDPCASLSIYSVFDRPHSFLQAFNSCVFHSCLFVSISSYKCFLYFVSARTNTRHHHDSGGLLLASSFLSIQSVRCLESDLEVSDNGDPLNGIICRSVRHSRTTVKERLRKPVREIE